MPAANRLIVPNELDGSRLDRALRHLIPGLGKNEASLLIGRKRVRVNGRPVTYDSWEVRNGYVIEIAGVVSTTADAHVLEPDWILADDGLLMVVNKPSGLRPEPRGVVDNDNLVTLLSAHMNEVVVPVHRIDRDTSGVMLLVRKSAPRSLRSELDAAFKGRDVTKHYIAVVALPNQLKTGRLVDLIGQDREHRDKMAVVERGGDRAETIVEFGDHNAKRQQLLLNPVTGRTHQLRVQLAFRGSPILGDRLYGSKAVQQASSRLLLHAHRFELPAVGDHGPRVFEAPVPRELTIIPTADIPISPSRNSSPTDANAVPRAARPARKQPNTPKAPRETKRQAADRITRKN